MQLSTILYPSVFEHCKENEHNTIFSSSSCKGCEFPQEWHGEWNLEGERESLHISLEDFGTKGFCLKHEDDIYVIYKRYVPRLQHTPPISICLTSKCIIVCILKAVSLRENVLYFYYMYFLQTFALCHE